MDSPCPSDDAMIACILRLRARGRAIRERRLTENKTRLDADLCERDASSRAGAALIYDDQSASVSLTHGEL